MARQQELHLHPRPDKENSSDDSKAKSKPIDNGKQPDEKDVTVKGADSAKNEGNGNSEKSSGNNKDTVPDQKKSKGHHLPRNRWRQNPCNATTVDPNSFDGHFKAEHKDPTKPKRSDQFPGAIVDGMVLADNCELIPRIPMPLFRVIPILVHGGKSTKTILCSRF